MTTYEIYKMFKQIASVDVICGESDSKNLVVPIQTNELVQLKRDIEIIAKEVDLSIKWLCDEEITQDVIPDKDITGSTDKSIAPTQPTTHDDSYSIIYHRQCGSEKICLHSVFRVVNASEHVILSTYQYQYEGTSKTNRPF